MAKRGQKAKPEHLKVVDGSGRPNAETRGTSKRGELPDPPEQLKGHALDFWNRVGAVLVEMGVAALADEWGLESMAVLYGQARDAEEHLEEHGAHLWHEKKGGWTKNPALVTSQQNRDKLRLWFNEFGMTPAVRASLAKGDGEAANVFEEFVG